MIIQGFIKAIGEPRAWSTKEGEERFTYPVTVAIPYVRMDGKTGEDELVCDHVAANPNYINQIKTLMENNAECDFTISFAVREYNGRLFNNIRLNTISQRISS